MTQTQTAESSHTANDLAGRIVRASARSTRAIVSFFVLTFVWTWGLWGLTALIKSDAPGLSGALFLASAFGPGIAAIVVTLTFGGIAGLRRWLGHCVRWRVGWGWYALAFLAPPLIMLAALGIHAALGGSIPSSPIAGHLLTGIAQFALIAIFGGPLGEEFGWRGYALPALTARMGWRRASLVIGAVWGAWHLPLLFMADTAQAHLPISLFLISTMGLSVVFARLSLSTGFSVFPAILLHTVINWWSMALPIMPAGGDARAYSLVAGITVLLALLAYIKAGPKAPTPFAHNAPPRSDLLMPAPRMRRP